ncbi:MAG: DNA repair protein RecN [Spirochaetales bacterium]|nr:DNA repair protein RecN [Spirochaetales bacterium]
MLEELNIHNYALIDRVNIKFDSAFNILSGETGAGKSILVGALGLLIGKKADPGAIRNGASEILVSALINIEKNDDARQWLQSRGIEDEEGTIILRRVVKENGRGSIYVQSAPIPRADLEELAALIFDMHGQHENQSLLKASNHRRLLDRYGRTEADALDFNRSFLKLTELRDRFNSLVTSERERLRDMEILEHAIKEIDDSQIYAGEEETLEKEHKILVNHEQLFRLVEQSYSALSESRGGALSSLRVAKSNLEEISGIDSGLSAMNNRLQDAFYEIEDLADGLRQYKSSVQFDSSRLQICEERLSLIHHLKKKYGDTIEEVLEYRRKAQDQLESIQNWEEDKQHLKQEIQEIEKRIRQLATTLSQKRKTAGSELQSRVEEELKQLGMPKVRFKVEIAEKKNEEGKIVYTPWGIDEIEFLISPNLGEPFRMMRKIASGGEISRIMLALKTVLADSDNIGALIFDEVDAGIGGEVAISVGEKLKQLSKNKQVLCITHLATIAARADHHLKVEKAAEKGRTFTRVTAIKGAKRVEEISRMLSGEKEDDLSLQHAEELLKRYGSL